MKKGVDKRGTGWYIGKAVGETAAREPKREKKVLDKRLGAW